MLWLAATADASSHSSGLGTDFYLALIGGLVFWVVLYFVYRVVMTGRKDFGLPVKRRLLVFHLKVDRDQSADVPMWWTDLQVQRAIRSYWRQSLRSPFDTAGAASGSAPHHSTGGDTSL